MLSVIMLNVKQGSHEYQLLWSLVWPDQRCITIAIHSFGTKFVFTAWVSSFLAFCSKYTLITAYSCSSTTKDIICLKQQNKFLEPSIAIINKQTSALSFQQKCTRFYVT